MSNVRDDQEWLERHVPRYSNLSRRESSYFVYHPPWDEWQFEALESGASIAPSVVQEWIDRARYECVLPTSIEMIKFNRVFQNRSVARRQVLVFVRRPIVDFTSTKYHNVRQRLDLATDNSQLPTFSPWTVGAHIVLHAAKNPIEHYTTAEILRIYTRHRGARSRDSVAPTGALVLAID